MDYLNNKIKNINDNTETPMTKSIEKIELVLTIIMLFGEHISIYTSIVPENVRHILVFVWVFWSLIFVNKKMLLSTTLKIVSPIAIAVIILTIKLFFAKGELTVGFFSPKSAIRIIYAILYGLMLPIVVLNMKKVNKKIILYVFMVAITITALPSFVYVNQTPDAIRNNLDLFGLVSFSYIYAGIPLVGISIAVVKYVKTKVKYLFLAFMFVYTLLVLKANFATALLLTLLTITLSIIFTKNCKLSNLFLFVGFMVLIFILLRKPIADIFYYLSEIDGFSPIMQHRINDVADMLAGVNLGSSFTGRLKYMCRSWDSFLSSPILGLPFDEVGEKTIGFHETWISMLGYGGIVCTTCVLTSVVMIYKYLFTKIKNYKCKQFLLLLTGVEFILSFLNPVFDKCNMYILWCIIPLCDMLFDDKQIFTKDYMMMRANKNMLRYNH